MADEAAVHHHAPVRAGALHKRVDACARERAGEPRGERSLRDARGRRLLGVEAQERVLQRAVQLLQQGALREVRARPVAQAHEALLAALLEAPLGRRGRDARRRGQHVGRDGRRGKRERRVAGAVLVAGAQDVE